MTKKDERELRLKPVVQAAIAAGDPASPQRDGGITTWAIERAAQIWCEPETSMIEMDTRLATAFAAALDAERAKLAVAIEGLVVRIAVELGVARSKTWPSDDDVAIACERASAKYTRSVGECASIYGDGFEDGATWFRAALKKIEGVETCGPT